MPEPLLYDQDIMTSTTSAPQTVGASDIQMSAILSTAGTEGYPTYARRIKCTASGTIGIQRVNDSAPVEYPCSSGDYIDGRIVAVGSTSHGSSSGMTFIAEQ